MSDKVVFLTGAGISVESGLNTFRNANGIWNTYKLEDVASTAAWKKNPSAVLAFYNERRRAVLEAKPNPAHQAIAWLERHCEVVIVTQNIDDLHERAGSTNVVHVHGEVLKGRSTVDPRLVYSLQKPTLDIGELCEKGSQLRPDVVFFGESIYAFDEARQLIRAASKVIVVGTSLTVFPVAGLVEEAAADAEKYLVSPDSQFVPPGYTFLCGNATTVVPRLVDRWIRGTES